MSKSTFTARSRVAFFVCGTALLAPLALAPLVPGAKADPDNPDLQGARGPITIGARGWQVQSSELAAALADAYGVPVDDISISTIGPTWGQDHMRLGHKWLIVSSGVRLKRRDGLPQHAKLKAASSLFGSLDFGQGRGYRDRDRIEYVPLCLLNGRLWFLLIGVHVLGLPNLDKVFHFLGGA